MRKAVNRKFRKLSREQRIAALADAGYLSDESAAQWLQAEQQLTLDSAERMIENVIGLFALPEGVALNFPLNGNMYQVPMVVEEPSVVAALSFSALLAEKHGGFKASADAGLIKGQIQLTGMHDCRAAMDKILAHKEQLLSEANSLMPAMLKRGGGARNLTCKRFTGENSGVDMLVCYISIDTCDAMGANQVNSVCEALAPRLQALVGGEPLLKILSNLADEALARAQLRLPASALQSKDMSGEALRDRIVIANDLALADPYRACTHNKGIMNGIDAVALATGNDWRSVEAAAHAYAARDGQYRALTQWRCDDDGQLHGSIELPIKVGTVGASLLSNPGVKANQELLGLNSASELAALMAAVGLAQNFAALRALASSGIQQGHMRLHARSVALSADCPDALFDALVARLVNEPEIKVWRAKEIIAELQADA
ncbi:hydroxymethylglutaryl-CoA reductase, degradative [Agaribacterium haliotis]|uniref:hydroxymethylglutaryl-CoA reductase, degradative n=1 Tax=Agaribacterium haliotis TaxID=2013869 RepID=UPI000BB55297|nr:hydroxymethylglutaryl-CoA reductase, degradative [Agaribacterium haliotis]